MLLTLKIFTKKPARPATNLVKNIFRGMASQKETDAEKRRAELMAKGLPKRKPIKGVKHIILVSSAKGGVGKSTTAVNLAVALKMMNPNKSVGLLDTDIFGPSIPLMMNLHENPLLNEHNLMIPLVNYGVKCMSLGFLITEETPVIMRGLKVMQEIEMLLRGVEWDVVDYLVVDTPPGTGDTHLSLAQNIPIAGGILVTTPQSAALQVTKRGAQMFKRLSIPIVGLVENMSSVICQSCSNEIRIFGEGTQRLAEEIDSTVLQSFRLNQEISDCADRGTPVVIARPDTEESKSYLRLAEAVVEFLSKNSDKHKT